MELVSNTELIEDIKKLKNMYNKYYALYQHADKIFSTSNKELKYRGKFIYNQIKNIICKVF